MDNLWINFRTTVKLTLEILALETLTALNWRKVSSSAGTYEDKIP